MTFLETVVLGRVMLKPILLERDVSLAESIVRTCMTATTESGTVVAVLGMAHCNGVKDLIEGRDAIRLNGEDPALQP